MSLVRNTTEYKCKVCGRLAEFDITDEKSYISKKEHDNFLGLTLTIYRVAHDTPEERHHNSVVVDHTGLVRDYRDAYSEPLHTTGASIDFRYWVYQEDAISSCPTNGIELALLISRDQHWVVDIICPPTMNASEIATLVVDKVEESYKVYTSMLQPMEAHIGGLDFHIWTSHTRILCVVLKNQKLLSILNSFVSQIFGEGGADLVPRRRLLNLVFHIIEKNPNLSHSVLSRIMNENLLFTKFQTPFEDRIPSIVERTSVRFPIAREVLAPILRGHMTLIEALETVGHSHIQDVLDLIEFINRRRILG